MISKGITLPMWLSCTFVSIGENAGTLQCKCILVDSSLLDLLS